ncbi:MAG: YadA-like family protein [Veillonella sp.]|uniref:ESPR-type extended signal peptide-containing protein n=1 Tax=Veillonella sp. TaxID=1926307 RepID=UPI00257E3471|nr:ESPR-type extended signal peptide-containing protein [Veillonella sp.]MBS7013062.1 YadA-like family protein [Veillonella sp.]
MNKIFKVVWSKTKECYVVVSEVAKNNGGKKKVLASVLATLAIMGAGAQMGTPVQAGANNSGTSVNLWGDKKLDGTNNSANIVGEESVAIGTNLRAGSSTAASTTPANYTHTPGGRYGGNAIAIGKDSSAHDDRNIAIGYNNTTEGQDSVAMGSNLIAGSGQSIAIGSTNVDAVTKVATQTIARGKTTIVNGRPGPAAAIAIGSGAQAIDGSGVLAMGQLAYASGNNNVAIGTSTKVNGSNATAIGSTAQALGKSSAAYGTQAFANGLGAVAVGPGAKAGVSNSTGTEDGEREGAAAVGRGSSATDKAATAIGWSANASKQNATALGYGSAANIAGGVALGSESKTTKDAGETGYNPATGRTNDYNKLTNNTKAALTSTRAAVSIGDDSASVTRQLTGLAAGTQDTDAVNVAQLKAVNLKFAGDSTQVTGSTDVRLNDGTFNVNGDGTLISTEATTTGIKVKAKVVGTITNDPSNDGKAKAPTTDGIATTTNVTNAINNSGWKVTSSNNGGTTNGTSVEKVSPGDKVTFSAGKNIVLDQNGKQFTYSLSDTVALTNTGSLTVGGTKVNNGGVTITAPTGGTTTNVTLTQSGLDNGGNKIVNVKDGDVSATSKDAVNGSQLHAVAAKERHIAPTTASHAAYTVDNNGDVTLDYVDGDGAATSEKAIIKGVAKQDLSNITNAGKQVITGLSNKVVAGDNVTVDETEDATTKQKTYKVNAKLAKLEDGTNTTVSGNGTAANPYHVNVAGDLTGISSITNGGTNNGKISFGPNKTVTVDGDHSITLNASTGKIGGLQNLTFDPTNFTSGQAATEDQLKSVHDTLKASELHIAPTESNRTGEHIAGAATSNTAAGAAANAYKYDATTKQVVLEYNDGTGANKTGTKAVIDFSALNTGAGASSWNIASDKVSTTEGTVAAGSAATQNIADGKTVTMKAGKNLTVKQENVGGNASVAFSLDKDLKDLDSVTTNKTITKEITLKDPNGGTTSTTIKKDGDRITYTNDGSTTVNKVANLADEKHITPGTYSVDSNGKVTMTYTDGNGGLVPNTTTVIDGLVTKKLDNIDNDGKKTITGLGTIVKAGDNVTVSEASDATTGQKTYTVNAVTPAVYTKADGTKVVKRSDGTYTTNLDGSSGNDVAASDVIISFQDAAGDTKNATSIVNNVGSAIKNQTGGDFLTKLDNANTATPNAAVNVSDLKNTADGLTNKGLKFDANSGGVKTNKLGSTVKVQGAGTSADANYSGANIKTFIDQDTTGNTTIDVKLDKNLTGINSISNTTTGPKMEFGGNSINITGGSLNMGGSNITNLKSGIVNNNATDDTNAANIGDVKKIAKDSDLHIAPTAGTTNNVAEYTVDANNKVTLTYQDGNGTAVTAPKAVIDLSALANKITSGYTFNANATANGGTVANDSTTPAAVTAVANGGTINYAAGKNLTVKQDIDTTNKTHTYTYSLDKDINVETVTVTGQNGKDGKIGINGKNGTNGVNGTNRVDIQVEKGVDGIDGKNGTDGISRIVYEDKTGTHTVATMDDGLKFTGNNTVIENKQKLGSLVKVQGEGTKEGTTVINPTTGEKELVLSDGTTKFESAKDNIAVVADGADTLTVKLNKKLKGLDSVQTKTVELGDHTTPGGTTNITYNTGDNRIEYTTPGTTDTKKVATTDDIWTIQGNGTDVKPVNGKVNVKAGENILITTPTTADGSMTINAVTPAVYTDKNGNKLTKDKDGKFHKPDGTEVAATDVITSIQDASGNVTGGNSIVNNVGSAIKGLGSTGDNYLTKLDLANTATPNAAVNVSDLKNTADALKSNELHIRPTTSGRTGETVNKNTAGTAESYKYDAATKSVTLKYNDGTGAGVTGTEAKIDLSGLADQITSGYTFSTNAKGNLADGTTATATAVGNGKTVSFAAGKNLTVEQNINATTGEHTYTYALSDKITAGKDGVNGKDGSVGVTGKDGSSVVINGADGSIGMTGPKGQDGKDGINGRDGANLSMTSAKGEQVLVNRDPAHNADTDKAERIVYVPKDASGNPIQDANGKNIVREVATMDDGLKFTGNNESTENKHKLGSLVKVQGEGVTENTTTNKLEANGEEFKSASGNIAVVADSIDKLTVKLNKNLAGINKISNGGSSITLNDNPSTTTPAVTISGGNLSMGDGTHNNKIVNVAPGTDDSDAVNYKQLKDAKTVLADGKNTKKSGTGTAADPYKVNVEGDLTDITSITNKADASGNAGKITFSPNQTVTVSGDHNITLDAGSGHIGGLTNLTFNPNSYTSGQAATEDQLKFVHDTLKANERHIAPTTVATGSTETKGGTANAAGTANVYKYDAASKTVTLSYNDGNGNAVTDTKAVIDLSNLSTGGTGASSWNIASDKVSATEGAVATGSAGTQNIADGKTVTMKAGKNLTVNQSNDGAGNASVAFSLDKNLENLDKVVVNGNDGATGQAGVSIVGPKGANGVDGNDGKVGIAGKDGKDAVSISGKDGVGHIGLQGPKGTPGTPGADGANLDITTDHGTQTLVKPEANNDNKSERIVYAPKDANGNPLKDTDGNDIKREVATMDDGLKFAGDDGQANQATNANVIKKQLNNVVDIIGGATKADLTTNNIGVNNDGNGKLLVQLSKNLKGLNSIQLGGNTIQSNGDNITFTTNGGTTKTVATTDQLWTIQANGTDVPAKSGKVNLVAGDHITITPDAANGKMTISATGFGSMDGFNVKTSADANGTHAGDTTQNIKNGKTVDMQAGKNLIVTQTNDGSGNTTVNYALNKDVDLGTNGSLKTGDTTINNDGFKNGNTTVGGNGMTIKDPTDPAKTVSLTKDGLNNGGNQITNVASGGNVDTNAANIGDIKRLAKDTRIKDGTYTVDNNGTVELTYVDGAGNQVKDASGNAITAKITGLTTLDSTRVNVAVNETGSGKAVGSKAAVKVTKGTEFVAGDNLIVERKANAGTDVDNSVVYSLNKDLKGIETIKNGNTTITLHNNPTTATDPTAVTITGGNINMGGNRIVNVAPAKDGTDAVNLDQLKAARTKVTSNDGTVSVNRSENTTTGEITYDLHVTPGQSPDLNRVNNRIDQLGEEIGRVGAQGAALSALKPIQYDPLEPTQIMAGYGNYRGNSAVALGVAHYKNESTLIHGGVSWAGGSSHMMANAGVTWKVGNRDSEAAVADRYRKGPISSAYAMQQEMAAMKAQNAGLKGEVSDLKAENEQMKAQIAAMMAKLGL